MARKLNHRDSKVSKNRLQVVWNFGMSSRGANQVEGGMRAPDKFRAMLMHLEILLNSHRRNSQQLSKLGG